MVSASELFLFDAQACPSLLSIGTILPSSGAREYCAYLQARCLATDPDALSDLQHLVRHFEKVSPLPDTHGSMVRVGRG